MKRQEYMMPIAGGNMKGADKIIKQGQTEMEQRG